MKNDVSNGLFNRCGCVALGALLLFSQIARGDIIPASRLANWSNAGVPGGIPAITSNFVNVLTTTNTSFQCLTNGTDISANLLCAITACPPNEVVYMPAGTYTLASTVIASTLTNVVIRGAGPGKTVIRLGGSNAGAFWFGNSGFSGVWYQVVGSAPIGATNVSVSSFAGGSPVVGSLLWIDQTNEYYNASDASTPDPLTTWPTGTVFDVNYAGGLHTDGDQYQYWTVPSYILPGQRNLQQMVRITGYSQSATTTNIYFWPPLFWNFSQTMAAYAASSGWNGLITSLVGIESMTVTNPTGVTGQFLINLAFADRCWLRNVEFATVPSGAIVFDHCVQCQVDHCNIHGGATAACDAYQGIRSYMCDGLLLENNILSDLGYPLWFYSGIGGVTAYNYITKVNHAQGGIPSGGWSVDGAHDGYPVFELYEGNVMPEWQCLSASGYHTLFRNWFQGFDANEGIAIEPCCVSPDLNSYYYNVVGNILGFSGGNWTYSATNTGYSGSLIYRLGWPDPFGGITGPGTPFWGQYNNNVLNTILRADNFDYANSNIADAVSGTLTNSYYLTSKPAWWGNSLPWPPFNPNNPSAASVTNIPAGYRYVYGVDPPGSSSQGGGSSGDLGSFKFFGVR
jgi:hypothetical protein